MSTANAFGQVVPASKVRIKGQEQVYDVGEVYGRYAYLYLNNKFVCKEYVDNLVVM